MNKVETVDAGIFRDMNSRGLTMKKDGKYTKYLREKHMEERMNQLENKLDKLLDMLILERSI